jgi:hypothetical protein
MRFMRMLTNAVAGGMLGAIYLSVIVLILNPQMPLVSTSAWHWFIAIVAFYGLHLSVAVYLLILVREVLASRPLYPGWLSVRLLAWLGAGFAAASALITWGNLRGFRAVLGEAAAARLQTAAVAATVAAVVLVGVALLRYSFGRKGSRPAGILLTIALVTSVAVPVWVRGPGDMPVPPVARARTLEAPPAASAVLGARAPRVRILMLDGASLGLIRERAAAGLLPNLGRVLDRGAAMDLATLKPTQAEPVWTAAATGKYPPRTGVRSNAVFRARPDDADVIDLLPDYCFAYGLVYQRYVVAEALTREAIRSRAFWDIAADYGIASGIVRWPLTTPASQSRGYLISDTFHLGSQSPLRLSDARAGAPSSAVDVAREVFDAVQFPDAGAPPVANREDDPTGAGGRPLYLDQAYIAAAEALEPLFAPQVTAVRMERLDALSHVYWAEGQAARAGRRETTEGRLLDQAYVEVDRQVGRELGRLRQGDLLLIVSGFGMERVGIAKQLLARLLLQPTLTGSHEGAPDGFLLAYGTHVLRADLPRGAIVDLAPTVLAYLGLPVARDMDGFARTDLFDRAYRRDHPVVYVGSHEK